jgi:hypothetical protein
MKDILLTFLREHAWYLALGLIALVTSRRSQIDAWASAHPRVAGVMKLMRGLGLDPYLLIQGLSLLIRKRLPNPPPGAPGDKV